MNDNKRNSLLEKNNIHAYVLTDWDSHTNPNCKFVPDQVHTVKHLTRKSEHGRYKKYAGQHGVVIAASTPDGHTMRGDNYSRQFTRYFIAFPKMKNKVVGLHSHYLRRA